MSLEVALREAIKRGFLHLSLDRHWQSGLWNAGYRNTDNSGVTYVEDADPIEAIKKALRSYRGPVSLKTPTSNVAKPDDEKRRKRERDGEDLI